MTGMFLRTTGRGILTSSPRRPMSMDRRGGYRLMTTTRTGSKKPKETSSKPADSSNKSPVSRTPQDGPRRLLVRRKKGSFVSNTSSVKHEVGEVRTHTQKAAVVRDTAGQTIFVASGRSSAPARPYQATPTGTFRRTQRLPLINASAILDRKEYCVRSASASTSKSGTGAARRLLQGKKDLLELLRQQIKKSHRRGPPASYVLQGHGIPVQLLQDHLDLADAVLSHHEDAAECAFHNHHGDLVLEWMRVRSKEGTNRATPWPIRDDWDHAMQLYLAAMSRLIRELGVVLHHTPAAVSDEDDESMDDYDNTFAPTPTFSPLSPRHWNVEFLRGLYYPVGMLPERNGSSLVSPIIEWTPLDGIAAPGHVCIRLQGFPSSAAAAQEPDGTSSSSLRRRKRRQAVTLCFDACFRNE